MLQTILSRAQTVHVPRLKLEEITGYLMGEKQLVRDFAESVAARSDGDLIEAIEISGNGDEKNENYLQFTQLMRVCYKKNVIDMMDWAEVFLNPAWLRVAGGRLRHWFLRMMVLRLAVSSSPSL